MIQLCVRHSELTYEVALSPPVPALIDTPGKVASALVSHFDHLDMNLSDLSLDDGSLEDKGLSCEVEKFDTSILLRADRLEIRFFSIEEMADEVAEIIQGVWEALHSISPGLNAKSHSLLFEIACEVQSGLSYRETLERFCRAHESLPKDTETAVVYYLPKDSSQGFLDSSFVLNRSAEVEGGIQLAVTLVFDGKLLGPEVSIQAGRARFDDLLRRLDIKLLKDSYTKL